MDDVELRDLLSTIDPKGRDVLRRLMLTEQFERDEFTTALVPFGTATARELDHGWPLCKDSVPYISSCVWGPRMGEAHHLYHFPPPAPSYPVLHLTGVQIASEKRRNPWTPPSLGPGRLGSSERRRKDTATVRWATREDGFRFVSNEAGTSSSSFALCPVRSATGLSSP